MKFFLSLFIIALSFGAAASSHEAVHVTIQNASDLITVVDYDRGKKKNRREKRINKKRKRKCHQFGRRVYAG